MVDVFFDKYEGSLDSKYYIPVGAFASTTNPQTANQIAEATQKLNAGVLGLDISNISPDIFQSIPKEHFSEIGRLTKLTGANVDLHAPVQEMDPAGFSRDGWSEQHRKEVERQFIDALEKGHLLDPNGNTPVNFHASGGVPGRTWRQLQDKDLKNLADPGEAERIRNNNMRVEDTMGIVNQDTGQVQSLRYDTRKGFGGQDEIWTPEVRKRSINRTEWENRTILPIFTLQKERAEVQERLINQQAVLGPIKDRIGKGLDLSDQQKEEFNIIQNNINSLQSHVNEIDRNIGMTLIDINDKIKKYGPKEIIDPRQKTALNNFNELTKELGKIGNEKSRVIDEFRDYKDEGILKRKFEEIEKKEKIILNNIVPTLSNLPTPELWKPTDEFSKDKTAETVANATFEVYKKYGKNTPITVVENVFPEWTLSRSEGLKDTIEKSRKLFAQKLMSEKNLSEEESRRLASQFIGVTWDVGHINMLRKQGFTEQEIIQEAKKIAPLVKQVHITDNFGFGDVHLPAGMGNVQIKEQLKELEKKGFKIEKGRLVHEGGGWWQHFKTDPIIEAMGNLDTPLYTMDTQTRWGYIRDTEGVYRYGFGDLLPEVHFKELYGGGFASLPKELGGQIGGDKSRFSGTPNQ
ncbi:sugar phosphate isomerase/epimerase [Candidatus Woesearchaeota archaeon]|nr:sugar phosphate isomerase/epimerase [Candidatus Woesearchaeota archaeon]